MAEAERKPRKWRPKSEMKDVGGHKGKLHREMGIPEGEKIPAAKLEAATHSPDREKRDDAIRAETMKGWKHGGKKRLRDVYRSKKG